MINSIWIRVKSACMDSLTVAWSYVVALAGAFMQLVDAFSDAAGDSGLKDQITAAIGDPKTTGRVLLAISIVTLLARMRTLRRAG